MTRSRETGEVGYRAYKKNYLINGGFQESQRGVTLSGQTVAQYLSDRWYIQPNGATFTAARQDSTFSVGGAYQFLLRAQSAVGILQLIQKVENVKSLPRTGNVTLSFLIKSTVPMTVSPSLQYNYGAGGSTTVTATGDIINVTTTEQYVTRTFALEDWSGKTVGADSHLSVRLTGQENLAYDFIVADVQLEEGSVATPFEYVSPQQNLAECQRYYESGVAQQYFNVQGNAYMGITVPYKQTKRDVPTLSIYDTNGVVNRVSHLTSAAGAVLTGQAFFTNQNDTGAFNVLQVNPGISVWGQLFRWESDAEL